MRGWSLGSRQGPASASVTAISVKPQKPIVDESVTVTFKTDRTLKAGYRWVVAISATECGDALSFNFKPSKRKVKKGESLSVKLRPSDTDLLGNSYSTWCQGKATARVQIEHVGSDDVDQIVGRKTFRFYGQP